ncbi:MAG: dethiobiotin synthase, partial [Chitinophagaceae bacterium]
MSKPIFITGIGTEIGKTVVSSLITTALKANYWKPIQAGFEEGADADKVASLAKLRSPDTQIFPEVYRLSIPASPHIAARKDNITIDLDKIMEAFQLIQLQSANHLIIEGAGGLMVPVNQHQFVANIIQQLQGCTALMWHFNHANPKSTLFAKQLLYSVEEMGLQVFPNYKTVWH